MEILNEMELPESKSEPVSTPKAPAPSPTSSTAGKANGQTDTTPKDDRETVKALLAEARNTRQVLEDFELAIKNGTFHGREMMAIAKGVSFVQAILAQNKVHVDNLQNRLAERKA